MDAAGHAFSEAKLYTDGVLYTLIHLPAGAIMAAAGVLAEIGTPFCTLIADKDEVTLVLPSVEWEMFSHRLPDARPADQFRLITFDLPLDHGLVGFMALVSRLLAESGVPIMAFSAFERDHILVAAAQFDRAWQVLQNAQTHP